MKRILIQENAGVGPESPETKKVSPKEKPQTEVESKESGREEKTRTYSGGENSHLFSRHYVLNTNQV